MVEPAAPSQTESTSRSLERSGTRSLGARLSPAPGSSPIATTTPSSFVFPNGTLTCAPTWTVAWRCGGTRYVNVRRRCRGRMTSANVGCDERADRIAVEASAGEVSAADGPGRRAGMAHSSELASGIHRWNVDGRLGRLRLRPFGARLPGRFHLLL